MDVILPLPPGRDQAAGPAHKGHEGTHQAPSWQFAEGSLSMWIPVQLTAGFLPSQCFYLNYRVRVPFWSGIYSWCAQTGSQLFHGKWIRRKLKVANLF